MAVNFDFKNEYNFYDLVKIMELLRAPGGCPWDREQTHESIKKNFIEETYEVIEAINQNDPVLLCEELGDVLMQVAFHAQMKAEEGVFTIDEVTDGVCKKLIERHPHVFGDVTVNSTEEVLTNWDKIKSESKNRKTVAEKMHKIPRELPALMRSTKLQEKAHSVGFDWEDIDGALGKLSEELAELRAALQNGDRANTAEELGDVLFSVVNVSRFAGCDAEEALTASSDKFEARFTLVEQLAAERGVVMENENLETLDALWDEAKQILKSK